MQHCQLVTILVQLQHGKLDICHLKVVWTGSEHSLQWLQRLQSMRGSVPRYRQPWALRSHTALTFLMSDTMSVDHAAGYITVAVLNTWAISSVEVLERMWYGLWEKCHQESILIYLGFQTPGDIFFRAKKLQMKPLCRFPILPLEVSPCVIAAQLK